MLDGGAPSARAGPPLVEAAGQAPRTLAGAPREHGPLDPDLRDEVNYEMHSRVKRETVSLHRRPPAGRCIRLVDAPVYRARR